MFGNSTVIEHPFGISVFGSTRLRIPPDSVTVRAAITRLEENPSEAFAKARKAEQSVTSFLRKAPVKESGLSRVSLSQAYRFANNERRPVGYIARIGLMVVVSELDQIENILSGLVDAGANEITSTEFHTLKLKELRARARESAINAAREKAEIYAAAARVAVGEVLHIQDMNPNLLRQEFHMGHTREAAQQDLSDSEPEVDSLDPSAIEIGAAVMVAFAIENSATAKSLAALGGTMPELKDLSRRD